MSLMNNNVMTNIARCLSSSCIIMIMLRNASAWQGHSPVANVGTDLFDCKRHMEKTGKMIIAERNLKHFLWF